MATTASSDETDGDVTVEEWAVSKITKMKINYRWEIQDFQCLSHKSEEAFSSPQFPSGDNQPVYFRIQLYPRCNVNETSDYVSLFLRLESAEKYPVRTEFTFKMMSVDETYIIHRDLSRAFPDPEDEESQDWGFSIFIKRKDLEAKLKESKSNTLLIQCQISILLDPVSVTGPTGQSNGQLPKQFSKDYGCLLADSAHSDFTIKVRNKKFRVHKAILHAQSSVFAAMLSSDMRETVNNEATIDDEEPNVFKKLLQFMYSGKVNASTEDALQLLPLADKYDVQDLKGYCENLLATRLTAKNVTKVLVLAEAHKAKHLKGQAFRYMNANSETVSKSRDWNTFVQQYPQLLAELFLASSKTDLGSH